MKKKKLKSDKEDKNKEKKISSKKDEKKARQANNMPAKPTAWDDPFDFGGLPHRDLKKNLGCG